MEIHRADVQVFLRPIFNQIDEEQERVVRRELIEEGYDVGRQHDYLTGYRHALLRMQYLIACA